MNIGTTDIAQFLVMALASGRIAFSLTKDDIFQPVREWIWMRSAPEDGMVIERTMDGDVTRPARMYHLMHENAFDGGLDMGRGPKGDVKRGHHFSPSTAMRKPAFWGQLWECPYCMSFWTSLIATVAWLLGGDAIVVMALPFAVWALANVLAVKGL